MKYSFILLYFFIISCGSSQNETNSQSVSKEEERPFTKFDLQKIKLPPDFSISIYAEVPNARSMCWGSEGTLFVGNRAEDKVYAVVDKDKNGKAEKVYTIANGLNIPNGVAFKNGGLYVAEVNRILRFDKIESQLNNPPKPLVVFDKFPEKTHHGWKFIAFGPDGKLYVPVGASCNICEEKDSIFATITRLNADGTDLEIYAEGIRNTVGFAWHPLTKELWFTENGGDNLGDDIPGDEINYAPQQGMHFGYPYCHQGNFLDPKFGKGKDCSNYNVPAKVLGAHVAALGMRFYTGKQFPDNYINQIFIAEHGSWNRSQPTGYKVGVASLKNNRIIDYKPFAEGWLQPDGKVLGRPVDVAIAPDGALLVSDDFAGVIYRIGYKK